MAKVRGFDTFYPVRGESITKRYSGLVYPRRHFPPILFDLLHLGAVKSKILAIESSCDDTAAAILEGRHVLSSQVSSQMIHREFGGVVPELASRDHQKLILPVIQAALEESGVDKSELDAIAVTYGPGLAGSLLVGISTAKALAMGLKKPLIGVNHLEGHVYSVFLERETPPFPYLALVVSGGHTQLVVVRDELQIDTLGKTRDDAAGEAFDKVGKLLGLPYPGGPEIDRLALKGDSEFHAFPRSNTGTYDFSFSGIKTAVLYYLNAYSETERLAFLKEHMADVCASFQQAIIDMLLARLRRAIRKTGITNVALVGGVSANSALRSQADDLVQAEGGTLYVPSLKYCMDNAAMIGVTALLKMQAGESSPLTLKAEPSLNLS